MTTELIEPKTPIRIDVVQKQYKNGMTLQQLATLYEVEEMELKPIVADIVPKRRNLRDSELDEEAERRKRREERNARIVELVKAGANQSEVAEQFGITRRTVSAILQSHGCTTFRTRQRINHEEFAPKVKKLMDAGLTNEQIQNELNITHANLQTLKRRHGLKLKAGRRHKKKGESS
jgi:DNA-binding CsgD family transcriptional regulator